MVQLSNRSAFGPNKVLDQLATELRSGARPLDRAAAEAVMTSVGADRRITVEEKATLGALRERASGPAREKDTEVGRTLLDEFAGRASGRLVAHQINTSVEPAFRAGDQWLRAVSFGLWRMPLPTYVGVDQRPGRAFEKSRPVADEALDGMVRRLAGRGQLEALLREFPGAAASPGHVLVGPTPKPDVEAKYQSLVADLRAGRTAENDVLADLRAYLKARPNG